MIPPEMSHSNDLVESVWQGERMGGVWESQRQEALNKPLERGQIVPVYKDGTNNTVYEGTAELIEKVADGEGRESWRVRMIGGHFRTVWIKNGGTK